jgi:hypothetical protein
MHTFSFPSLPTFFLLPCTLKILRFCYALRPYNEQKRPGFWAHKSLPVEESNTNSFILSPHLIRKSLKGNNHPHPAVQRAFRKASENDQSSINEFYTHVQNWFCAFASRTLIKILGWAQGSSGSRLTTSEVVSQKQARGGGIHWRSYLQRLWK